jgi:hypothetical protein
MTIFWLLAVFTAQPPQGMPDHFTIGMFKTEALCQAQLKKEAAHPAHTGDSYVCAPKDIK